MNVQPFTTQQTGLTNSGSQNNGGGLKGPASLQDALFGNFLAAQAGSGKAGENMIALTKPTGQSMEGMLKNLDLSQSVSTLKNALENIDTGKLENGEGEGLNAFISTALNKAGELNLDQDVQSTLKKFLNGQPQMQVGELSAKINKEVFGQTEDASSGEALFAQILANVTRQVNNRTMKPEQLVATGLNIEQLNNLAEQISENGEPSALNGVKAARPDGMNEDDLISLLGLFRQNGDQPLHSVHYATGDNGDVMPLKMGSDMMTRFQEFQAALKAQLSGGNANGQQASQAARNLGAANGQAANAAGAQTAMTAEFADLLNFFNSDLAAEIGEKMQQQNQQWITPSGQIPSALNSGNLTSHVTQTPQAASSHPATNHVAVNIQKNINGTGQARNWTLQLDPPELGRVEVKLNFGNDNSVKTHMVIEKPETYMMLQRDSHVLERALQEAGLDASDNELSFELAQDDHNFGDGEQGQGENGNGRGGSGDNGEMEIIETTMDWYVDPETGMQRYDLMA